MPEKSKVEELTDFSKDEKITQGKMAENFFMKVWLETILNIVGEHGLNSILDYNHLEKYTDNFQPENGKCETPTAMVLQEAECRAVGSASDVFKILGASSEE